MPELWQDQAAKAVRDNFARAKLEGLTEWRAELNTRRTWYDGDPNGLIKIALKKDSPESYKEMREVAFGFLRKVVRKTAQVYWMRPTRELTKDGKALSQPAKTPEPGAEPVEAKVDPLVEYYQDLVSRGRLDVIMREVDRYTRLYTCCFVWVQPNDHGGEGEEDAPSGLKFSIVEPQNLYVVQDPKYPGDIARCFSVCFSLQGRRETGQTGPIDQQMWIELTQNHWTKFYGHCGDGATSKDEIIDEGDYSYGRIPLCAFYDVEPNGQLFPCGGYLMTDANETISAAFSHVYDLAQMQAGGLLVMQSDIEAKEVKAGIRHGVRISSDGSVYYASPQAQIEAFRLFLEWMTKAFSGLEDIPPSVFSTEVRELSGYAMTLENLPLIRGNMERQELFAQWDGVDLFNLIRVVNNEHLQTEIPKEIEQSIAFEPLAYPADPQAEWTMEKEEIELGIGSPIEAIMKRNPDLDRDEAIERYKRNMADKKLLKEAENPPTNRFGIDVTRGTKPGEPKPPPFGQPPEEEEPEE